MERIARRRAWNMIPLADQMAEVRREIALRESVYRKWKADDPTNKEWIAKLDRQMERMRAVLETLEKL